MHPDARLDATTDILSARGLLDTGAAGPPLPELIARAFQERGWSMEPGDLLDLEDLPAHIHEEDGERKLKPCAEVLLTDWDRCLTKFWQVCPKEMVDLIEHPLSDKAEAKTA